MLDPLLISGVSGKGRGCCLFLCAGVLGGPGPDAFRSGKGGGDTIFEAVVDAISPPKLLFSDTDVTKRKLYSF